MTDALQGHQDRVNEATDIIYDWFGEEERSSAEQFVDGFITGILCNICTVVFGKPVTQFLQSFGKEKAVL